MEKKFTIPTPDGFEINGVLNWKEKSEKLIIFCHGLTGYMDEAHYVCGKDYFVERGYGVLRFDFYDGGEKNRKLKSCSIDDHARDIETILENFSEYYGEIILIGHSLGGPSIVRMKKNLEKVSKIVFWDPALDQRELMKGFEKYGDIFLFDGHDGRHIQVSEDMVKQRAENHMEMLENFSFSRENMKIIFAGGNAKINFKAHTDSLGIAGEIIDGANHGFTQEGKFEELFEKTLEFIAK